MQGCDKHLSFQLAFFFLSFLLVTECFKASAGLLKAPAVFSTGLDDISLFFFFSFKRFGLDLKTLSEWHFSKCQAFFRLSWDHTDSHTRTHTWHVSQEHVFNSPLQSLRWVFMKVYTCIRSPLERTFLRLQLAEP